MDGQLKDGALILTGLEDTIAGVSDDGLLISIFFVRSGIFLPEALP